MNSFSSYYYKEQEALNEIHALNEKFFKSSYASNIFRKLFGSKTLRINPKDYNITDEVGQKGFNELIDKLAADASDPRKETKKTWIVDAYAGKFNPKKDLHPNFPPVDKVEDTTVYKTNKGGKIITYYFVDDEGDPRFFVGLDNKGERFFLDKLKKSFKVFQQQSKTGGIWQTLSKGDAEGQQPKVQATTLDKADWEKLVPTESTNIEGDYLTEEGRPLIWDKEKRIWKTQTGNKVTSFRPEDFAVNDRTGKDAESGDEIAKTLQQKLDKDREAFQATKKSSSKEEPKAEPEAPKAEPKASKEEPKAEPEAEPEPKKAKPTRGELYGKIKKDLKQEPVKIKPTKSIQTGWSYFLKDGGAIHLYLTKDGEYKVGFDKKGKNVLVKSNIINPDEIEALA
jgi:hypothetical protein